MFPVELLQRATEHALNKDVSASIKVGNSKAGYEFVLMRMRL